jgi:hypothetical protein
MIWAGITGRIATGSSMAFVPGSDKLLRAAKHPDTTRTNESKIR